MDFLTPLDPCRGGLDVDFAWDQAVHGPRTLTRLRAERLPAQRSRGMGKLRPATMWCTPPAAIKLVILRLTWPYTHLQPRRGSRRSPGGSAGGGGAYRVLPNIHHIRYRVGS